MPLKTFLHNRTNSRKFRLNGILPSNRLPSKRKLCQAFRDHVLYSTNQLPHKVDLRNDMTPVEDQSKLGSCAANCLAGAYEYLTKKSDGRNTDVSRLFVYYNARMKGNRARALTDSGCSMTDAIEALEEFGTCLESIWPYEMIKVNTRPSDRAFQEAKNHTIADALQVEIDLYEMKSCLAQGFPFAFGLRLFRSFDKASKMGVVPMPDASERARSSHGSHALLAVGYSDHSQSFIVRNSWGENWGDRGYCYIPYDYMTNSQFCFDAWAVRKLANDNFSKDHWDNVDATNYLRAAIIAVMSMDRNGNNDDDACVIDDVHEDDEPNRNRHDSPQQNWTAADYYQHETGYRPDNPYPSNLQASNTNYNSYPPTLADIMNASDPANQQQPYGSGYNNPQYNYPNYQ